MTDFFQLRQKTPETKLVDWWPNNMTYKYHFKSRDESLVVQDTQKKKKSLYFWVRICLYNILITSR